MSDIAAAYTQYASYRSNPAYADTPSLVYEKIARLHGDTTADKCERLYRAGLVPLSRNPEHFTALTLMLSVSVPRAIKEADTYLSVINR